MGARLNRINEILNGYFEDGALIEIQDDSRRHKNHMQRTLGAAEQGAEETHFVLKIVSARFEGKSRLERHRLLYDLLANELNDGLHALKLDLKTPKENS